MSFRAASRSVCKGSSEPQTEAPAARALRGKPGVHVPEERNELLRWKVVGITGGERGDAPEEQISDSWQRWEEGAFSQG